MKPIEEMLRKYIADNILFSPDGYPYRNEDSFLENGILDSTNILELVLYIEEEFHFLTDDDEITPENFDSVSKLSGFIQSKTNHKVK